MLKSNHEAAGLSPEGVIGHTLVDSGGVVQRPSSTYWNGLRVFNIVNTPKSLSEFCRDWKRENDEHISVDADEGNDDLDRRHDSEVRRPPGSKGPWRTGLTLELSLREADFLSERFRTAKGVQNSVAAQVLSAKLENCATAGEYSRFSAFSAWAVSQPKLSETCRRRITLAQRFSDAIEGAHIVFNRLLARKLEDDKLSARCVSEFDAWRDRVALSRVFHATADQEWLDMPSSLGIIVNRRTSSFLQAWNEAMCRGATRHELDNLVNMQALNNKPGRSLLLRLPQAKSDWYGMKELDYRWSTTRRMLGDITEGQAC